MLVSAEVENDRGAVLTLPLIGVDEGYIVREIEGLDPVKATLVSSGVATLDGAQFHSARRETRNIVIKIDLEPDYVTSSVEDLRRNLYNFFMPKTEVTLRFTDDTSETVYIKARVETFESALFTAEPQVAVSMVCYDPDFKALAETTVAGSTTSGTTVTNIVYDGSVETGILFTLAVNRTLTEFSIYHTAPDGTLRSISFAGSLISGDTLAISTVAGSKYARRTSLSVQSSVLYGISPQSFWIELQPGTNGIRVYATGAAIPYTIKYTTRYGGL